MSGPFTVNSRSDVASAVSLVRDSFRERGVSAPACPLIAVAGNCDMFSSQQRMARAAYGAHRILAVHGHLQDVKYGYDRLSYYAEEVGANIALFGHTHEAYAGWMGGVLLVNPGALMDGRYAELVLDGDRATPYLKSLKDEK